VPGVRALDLQELWVVVGSGCEMLQVWGEEAVSEDRSSQCPRRPSSHAPRRACRPLMKSQGLVVVDSRGCHKLRALVVSEQTS